MRKVDWTSYTFLDYLSIYFTSNSNHRIKSAVDMPICVLKRGDLCDRMSSRENEARFVHQNEVNLRVRETNGRQPRSVSHAFAQAAQRKHKIRRGLPS